MKDADDMSQRRIEAIAKRRELGYPRSSPVAFNRIGDGVIFGGPPA